MQQQFKPTANQQMVQPLAPKKKAINKKILPVDPARPKTFNAGMTPDRNPNIYTSNSSSQGGLNLKPSNGMPVDKMNIGRPEDKPGFGMPPKPGASTTGVAGQWGKSAPKQTIQPVTSNGLMGVAAQSNSVEYKPVAENAPMPEANVPTSQYQDVEYNPVAGNAPQFESNTPQTEFNAKDYESDGYTGVQGDANYSYDPRDESLVQNQITGLLNPESDLMRKAIAQAQGYSASRGLQSSSIGSETALSSMIDKALPIAQQDANTYANADQTGWQQSFTADQNNLSREHDASMFDKQGKLQTDLQNDQLSFTNDQNNANRTQQTELQQLQYKQNLGLLDAQGEQRLQELNAQQGFQSNENNLNRQQQAELQELQYKQSLGMLDAQGAQRMQELNAQQEFNLGTLDRQAEIQQKRDELMNQFEVGKMDKTFLQDLEKTKLTWEHDDAVFERNLNGQIALEFKNASADSYNKYLEQMSMLFSNPNLDFNQMNAGVTQLNNMFEAQKISLKIIYDIANKSNSADMDKWKGPGGPGDNDMGPLQYPILDNPIPPPGSGSSSSGSGGGGKPGGNIGIRQRLR